VSTLIDLLPPSCKEAARRRLVLQRWLMAYASAAIILGGAGTLMRLGIGPLRQQRDALEAEADARWTRQEELARLRAIRNEIVASIDRHDRLAAPVPATKVLGVIASGVPNEVTLTSAAIAPREHRKRKAAAGDAAARLDVDRYLSIEIEGVATGDGPLTLFAAELSDSPLFDHVSLESARSQQVGDIAGRVFRITGRISLDSYYEFASADDGGLP
jgi:Tfp pilus assembly protein PilN